MANIITELALTMSANWYVSKKLNSVGRVGENTVTKLTIEPTEILDNVTYELEIMGADGGKNVAELTVEGTELYLILTANMLTTSGITKMQVRAVFEDNSIKKSNIFELKVNRSISATDYYEEYAVTIFDQLVAECQDIIDGAEGYVERAETAASNAEDYASNAHTSEINASNSADNAASSATNASNSANAASTSAGNAHTYELNAKGYSESAATSAGNASTSETNAANSATAAGNSEVAAGNSANAAATSATNAHNSEVAAGNSETNASASATEAAEAAETVASSVAQINENTWRINDLEAIIGGYTLTDLPTGAVASVTNGTALLMPSLKVGIEPVQAGSGDPSPDNIRAISGWTAANVTRSGKNLMSPLVKGMGLDTMTGRPVISNISAATDYISVNFNATQNYFLSGLSNEINSFINAYNADKQSLGRTAGAQRNSALLSASSFFGGTPQGTGDIAYIRIVQYAISSQTTTIDVIDTLTPQLELGTTATTYEPYTGQIYNIQFTDGDNPLTVYGGNLNTITGLLTVTDAYIASYAGETLPSTWISDRDVYAVGATPTTGAEVVYTLENSVTYHLTPTQIRTLVGNNNIWADTGDITEGKYYGSPS